MQIKNFPNMRQSYDYDCGAQVLQAIFAYYGIDIGGDKAIKLVKTKRSGTEMKDINSAAKKYGFKTDFGKMTIEKVKKYINKKIPVILLIQAWSEKKVSDWKNDFKHGHYVIAIKYDKNKIYFEDPESIFRTYLTYKELEERWHDVIKGKKYFNYGLAIFGKKPTSLGKTVHVG